MKPNHVCNKFKPTSESRIKRSTKKKDKVESYRIPAVSAVNLVRLFLQLNFSKLGILRISSSATISKDSGSSQFVWGWVHVRC